MRDSHWAVLEVERIAREQLGVASRQQAADAGVRPRVLSRLLAAGQWRPYLGVLLVPAVANPSDGAYAMALQLRRGPEALVSGPTALRLQGRRVPDPGLIAWVPRSSMPRVAEVRLLRDDAPRETRLVRGVRLAAPMDALLDTMITVTQERARQLLDTALQLRWLTPEMWAEAVPARLGRGRSGVARLRGLGLRIAEGTHSDGERRCAGLLRSAGITGWIANYLVRNELGRVVAELDFAFPDLHLYIEVDGREAHSGAAAFERDRRRQNDLALRGWTVLRFTWHQIVHEPEWVVAQVLAAMAACSS